MPDSPAPLSADNVAPKSIFASRTLLGIAVMLLPLLARKCGVQLGDADAQEIVNNIAEIGGSLLAIYGRLKASRPLTLTPGSTALLALVFLPGCAGVNVSAAFPLGDSGKAVVATEGKAVSIQLRGTLPVPRSTEGLAK